ncbi:phosphatases II, partial [Fistulina hepatica ATCC 64428]
MSIPQSQPQKPASLRRKKGPPKAIFIPGIDAAEDEPQACLAPSRNHGGLSLNLPSAGSSTHSLLLPQQNLVQPARQQPLNSVVSELSRTNRLRRPSAVSLPSTANPLMRTRAVEDGDPAIPYQDGPIEFLPGMWLGSEDNAKDWKGLAVRGIRSILNVAKELSSPFDDVVPLRAAISTPNLGEANNNGGGGKVSSTYLPPSTSSGRPGMNYLKLQWSHGQQDLVEGGFPAAMTFVDAAVCERSEGVLIHCQCGMSRSATVAIALVMRAAAERSPRVPPEVWDLKGMQGAYDYVKSKSRWAGPNMSLIYQLLEYEKKLQKFDEEWARRRQMLDDESDNSDDAASPVAASVMEEALALDKAMEDRLVAKQS